MHYTAILNKDGGTLKSANLDELSASLTEIFEKEGHSIVIKIVAGTELDAALDDFLAHKATEALLIAGGDGSVSTAAAKLATHQKALGVLPAGTMNLFARSLRVPLDMLTAAKAIATGSLDKVDMGSVNGRYFIHHVSIGLHPKAMRLRNKADYSTRYGKMLASCRALLSIITNPPSFKVFATVDDGDQIEEHLSAISISNNEFSDAHLPYADTLSKGKLGIYFADKLTPRTAWQLMVDVFFGGWLHNPAITDKTAQNIKLVFPKLWRKSKASIDGELIDLERELNISIHLKVLSVIAPNQEGQTFEEHT